MNTIDDECTNGTLVYMKNMQDALLFFSFFLYEIVEPPVSLKSGN